MVFRVSCRGSGSGVITIMYRVFFGFVSVWCSCWYFWCSCLSFCRTGSLGSMCCSRVRAITYLRFTILSRSFVSCLVQCM